MDARYILISIPFFFLLIAFELVWGRVKKKPVYVFDDAVSSLGCGVGQQVLLAVFFTSLEVGGYVWVYEHARVATIPDNIPTWLILTLGVDLAYYVYHRASHRVSFLWATHVVHHQSEEFNLSTALRQSWFTGLTAWIFYLPLAVLGFSPAAFLSVHTLNILYQFWIHTRAIGSLGPLEWFLNTPSHHRVHHGVDPIYIDKNYAGVFIVWDKLFGTFEAERHEPAYGVVEPLQSFSPTWANVYPFLHLLSVTRRARSFSDAVKLWVMPPGWRPTYMGGELAIPEITRDAQVRYAVKSPAGLKAYIVLQFALCAAATSAILTYKQLLPALASALIVVWIVLGLSAFGGLSEQRRWAVPVEVARMLGLVGLGAWAGIWMGAFVPLAAGSLAVAVLSAFWVTRYHNRATA